MPLSEEEQRILHEMEQKLYEHDRGFVERVRLPRQGLQRSVRVSVVIFSVGLVVLLLSFRQSLLLATIGFLLMLRATLAFERSTRLARSSREDEAGANASNPSRARTLAGEVSTISRRFRSRFHPHR